MTRFRVNSWNLNMADAAIDHYTSRGASVVLTYMAYYGEAVPKEHHASYVFKQRTLNSYWVPTETTWNRIAQRRQHNPLVFTCGRSATAYSCRECGGCLREYYACKARLNNAHR